LGRVHRVRANERTHNRAERIQKIWDHLVADEAAHSESYWPMTIALSIPTEPCILASRRHKKLPLLP
jgi:hypothetical protein